MIAMLQIEHKRRQGPEKKLTLFSWHGKPVEKEKIERARKRLRFTEDDNHSIGWFEAL
jgi:hypothetical protein